jgi:hypothetical protein
VPWLITALCITLALAALASVFRTADLSGGGRALWTVIVLVLPILGAGCVLRREARLVMKARAAQAPPWGAKYPRSPAAYLPLIAGLLRVERN